MSSILKVGGSTFRCKCGCNVFSEGGEEGLWICNGCGTEYGDETYKPKVLNKDIIRKCSDMDLAEIFAEMRKIGELHYGINNVFKSKEEAIEYWYKWLNSSQR